MMARGSATLEMIPYSLGEALQLTLAPAPTSSGQQTAQREIMTALENAIDAAGSASSSANRRSIGSNGPVCAGRCALLAIAMVHSDDRLASPSRWDYSRSVWPFAPFDPRSRPAVYRADLGRPGCCYR